MGIPTPQQTPYNMLIKPEGDSRRYCGACELPQEICACEEARLYDLATCQHEFEPTGYGGLTDRVYECRKCGEQEERDIS